MLKNKWTVIYLAKNIAKFIINNYQLFGELLKRKFTKKKVLKDMKKLINFLSRWYKCYIFDNSNDTIYYNIARICIEWFDASNDKKNMKFFKKN